MLVPPFLCSRMYLGATCTATPLQTMPARAMKTPYIPAKTQLRAFQRELPDNAASLHVEIGNVVSWPWQLTRPIVDYDVQGKIAGFIDKDGWLPSYNVLGRALSPAERTQLVAIIQDMRSPEQGETQPHRALWLQNKLHIKVIQ